MDNFVHFLNIHRKDDLPTINFDADKMVDHMPGERVELHAELIAKDTLLCITSYVFDKKTDDHLRTTQWLYPLSDVLEINYRINDEL